MYIVRVNILIPDRNMLHSNCSHIVFLFKKTENILYGLCHDSLKRCPVVRA